MVSNHGWEMPFVEREEVVPMFRKLNSSQVGVMPVQRNTKEFEPEDVLLAVLMNLVHTRLERNALWINL